MSICVAVIATTSGVWYWNSLQPGRKLDAYLEFIRPADKIELLATTDPWFPSKEIGTRHTNANDGPGGDYERSKKLGISKETVVSVDKREQLIKFVKSLRDDERSPNACFEPRHFIYASKGQERIEINICITCGTFSCDGTNLPSVGFSVRRDAWEDATAVFGVDLRPAIERMDVDAREKRGQAHLPE